MLVLGIGGRLAMRGISMWESRARQFTAGGTLRVMGFGAIFGAAGAGLRLGIDALARRFSRARPERCSEITFAVACLGLGVVVLTPLTVHRLMLFLPVIALYVLALESLWRRTEILTARGKGRP